MIKPRRQGETYKPTAIVRKVKRGIPTKIEINGIIYNMTPSQDNTRAMYETINTWKRLGHA